MEFDFFVVFGDVFVKYGFVVEVVVCIFLLGDFSVYFFL